MHAHVAVGDETEKDQAERTPSLSRRQAQVLVLVAEGATDGEIALRLHLTRKTVAHYVEHSRRRLGAVSRAQAIAVAMRHGLLSEPSEPEETGMGEPDQDG